MVRQAERPPRRTTVLVLSGSPAFERLATPLLEASGFVPVCALEWEAAWLALTRTQPGIVLCDAASTAPHVARVAAEAETRGIPLLHMDAADLQTPDALRVALEGALARAAGPGAGVATLAAADASPAAPAEATRRDSLAATLQEIEQGALTGVGVIVVNRGWWDELGLGERTALRQRCEGLGITLRADDRLSRHFVEVAGGPAAPPMSSERNV